MQDIYIRMMTLKFSKSGNLVDKLKSLAEVFELIFLFKVVDFYYMSAILKLLKQISYR